MHQTLLAHFSINDMHGRKICRIENIISKVSFFQHMLVAIPPAQRERKGTNGKALKHIYA